MTSLVPETYTYNEVFNILTKVMNYSWRKGNTRPPRFLRQGLAEDKIVFKEFISNLNKQNLLLYTLMNEVFNLSIFPWYSWMKKGFPAENYLEIQQIEVMQLRQNERKFSTLW